MTVEVIDTLVDLFPTIIEVLPEKFDSHQFILKLAQRYQQEYVVALYFYSYSENPFQIVHGQIAKRLRNLENLVVYDGETDSSDIFGQVNSAACWEKVNA